MEAEILRGLIARGVPAHIAQGIVANMIAESGLDTGINEIAPVVPGSRGGYGLNQWTGPRRVQFEAFAKSRGVDPSDLNAQLDFTLWELQNSERAAYDKLKGAGSAEEAARIYSDAFLRPGTPNMDRRIAEARRLSGNALPPSSAPNALPRGNAPSNPLAALAVTAIDPRDFMTRREFAAPIPFTV